MSSKNLLSGRGVKRRVSFMSTPALTNLNPLNGISDTNDLTFTVEFLQLEDDPKVYTTGCPNIEKLRDMSRLPAKLVLVAPGGKWVVNFKDKSRLDITKPKVTLMYASGSTSEITLLRAQIVTGRNPVVWLVW